MKKTFLVLVLSLSSIVVFAQVNNNLLTTLTAVAGMRERLPAEKLYLQLDKPYYTLDDTLRFKAYLLKADFLKPSSRSGLLYIEVDNADNKMVKRIMVPLISGISWGNIALESKEFPQGNYTLRAYTNWMRNFGEDYIYKRSIYISALGGSTLVSAGFKTDNEKITASLRFTGLDKNELRLRDMQLRVKTGTKTLFRDKLTTGIDGSMQFDFNLTDKSDIKNLLIQAQEASKGREEMPMLTVPIVLNRIENTDVQFMPEGGNMVAGLPTRIGFKAVGENGRSEIIAGKIYDSKQQVIAAFRSTHNGMGNFELLPQTGESYFAKVILSNDIVKNYPLPAVNPTGTTIRINPKGKDSLEIILSVTPGLLNTNYYLIGQTREMVCYTAPISFKTETIKKTIGKDLFPSGIAHFTLLNNVNQPLNERIVYIDHNDNLQISITPDRSNYGIRDSIAVKITAKNAAGKPVRGTFSIAVTDDDQVKADSTNSSILSNLLLTSDLKGTVEESGWYFESNSPDRAAALDNLLLTQGWVGYNWKEIFNPTPKPPQYAPEPEFAVQGKVTNAFNKPIEKTPVTLLERKPLVTLETTTDKDGRFVFKDKNLFPVDSAFFMIQTKNKNGKSFNVGIDVDEFVPPVFAFSKERITPWYVNSDTVLLKNTKIKAAQLKAESAYRGEGQLLKEVTIKEKKTVKGSKNRNGPGEADIVLDEKDMEKGEKMSLYEFMQKTFTRFYKKIDNDTIKYILNGRLATIVIDGIFPDLPIDLYMDYFIAEDIKGIEIMASPTYAFAYNIDIDHLLMHKFDKDVPIYVEITTYAGHGPFLRHTPGRYVYKPVPFSLPKEFYRPRYTIKNNAIAMGTDLRSTIHWAPQVLTDKDGKATVSFFSADKPGDYTLILEGTDLNGNLGYKRQKIKVNQKAGSLK